MNLNNVTKLGANAFSGCTSLIEIKFNAISLGDLSSDNFVFYCAGQNGDGIAVTVYSLIVRL